MTGLIKSVTVNGKTTQLKQEFMWYPSKSGDNSNVNQRASGAYIFRPDSNAPLAIPSSSGIKTTTYSIPIPSKKFNNLPRLFVRILQYKVSGVALLVERSLLTPEVHRSNPIIVEYYI